MAKVTFVPPPKVDTRLNVIGQELECKDCGWKWVIEQVDVDTNKVESGILAHKGTTYSFCMACPNIECRRIRYFDLPMTLTGEIICGIFAIVATLAVAYILSRLLS
jgi:hypothetical protein